MIGYNYLGDQISGLNAFFAPVSLGGFDCPTIISMTTNEVPDSLTKYTYVMLSYCRALFAQGGNQSNASEVATKIISVYGAVMGQEVEAVGGRTLMVAPRSVRVEDVASPESVALSKLRSALRDLAVSEVYRSAFEAADIPRSDELHSEVLRSGTWDAAILACVAEYSPDAIVSPLMTKAVKSEVLASRAM